MGTVESIKPEDRLRELGIQLPGVTVPNANLLLSRRSGSRLYLSGQGPKENGVQLFGKVGHEVSVQEGYRRARLTGLVLLANLRQAIGSLDGVSHFVKILGMVNAVPDFTEHPAVIDGCSDLLVEVFGPAGCHARSAVGVASLPKNISVEIEAIVEIQI